jgi:hypothetical protein
VTEHGADPVPDGMKWVDIAFDAFDDVGASSMYWIWRSAAT